MIWSSSGLMGKENQVSDMQIDGQNPNSDHANPKFSINGCFFVARTSVFFVSVLVGCGRFEGNNEILKFYVLKMFWHVEDLRFEN